MPIRMPIDGSDGLIGRIDGGLARLTSAEFRVRRPAQTVRLDGRRLGGVQRIGVICNARAHRNLTREFSPFTSASGIDFAAPRTQEELHAVLARFASRGIDALLIDGGDGTIRDVITAAAQHFGDAMPDIAVVPAGKTNALAIDLGVPTNWTIKAAIEAIHGPSRTQRSPVEIRRVDGREPMRVGFLFGAGAFVRATALAQETHRIGAFNGLAVGLSLAGGIAQTLFGGRDNVWRRGDPIRVELDDGRSVERPFYLLLASTLERLPLGLKPFGRPRPGMKLLGVDAPPKALFVSAPILVSGSEAGWLARAGYHRLDANRVGLTLDTGFVLDGETYAGGELIVAQGRALNFVVP